MRLSAQLVEPGVRRKRAHLARYNFGDLLAVPLE
jgi:hypothetical protein